MRIWIKRESIYLPRRPVNALCKLDKRMRPAAPARLSSHGAYPRLPTAFDAIAGSDR